MIPIGKGGEDRAHDGPGSPQKESAPRRYRRFTVRDAVKRRLRGATFKDLELLYGVPDSTISDRLKGALSRVDVDRVAAYRERRLDVLDSAELTYLDAALDPAKIQAASARDLVIGFGILHDKRRLTAGLSTANLELHSLVEAIERDRARTRRLPVVADAPNNDGSPRPA